VNVIKWFRNRQRIKRRLHWARCGWLLLACVLLVGCQDAKLPRQQALFRGGQFIDLRLNGVRGQIIDVVYLNEYELTFPGDRDGTQG